MYIQYHYIKTSPVFIEKDSMVRLFISHKLQIHINKQVKVELENKAIIY